VAGVAAARYDGLARWYDEVMRDPSDRAVLAQSAYELLGSLLGRGSGLALDIGCGTGLASLGVRELGYQPVGVDISVDQLRIAVTRLPAVQGDASRLPIASGSVPTAYSSFVSSDLDDYRGAVREVYRVLAPGGRYVSVCLHPCLNGGYSLLQPDSTVLVRPGYRDTGYHRSDEFGTTIRSQVGAWHRPLSEVVGGLLAAGFRLEALSEDGPDPIPSLLGLVARKPL
jgi:SAM-dependent methyltransferase